jgi:hypothetical protein
MTYIFGNEQGRQLKRLQEAPLFADSTVTAGIQMADIIAPLMYANTYHLQLSPGGLPRGCGYLKYTHVERYWTHLQKLKFQSQGLYQGYRKNGFRGDTYKNDDPKTEDGFSAILRAFRHTLLLALRYRYGARRCRKHVKTCRFDRRSSLDR